MQPLIERLARELPVHVERRAFDWGIGLGNVPGYTFEICVPFDTLEWFVAARDTATGAEVWSDWMDYAGYVSKDMEDPRQLTANMERDIEWFVTTLSHITDFRVETKRVFGVLPRRAAEWHTQGEWRSVSMTPALGAADAQ